MMTLKLTLDNYYLFVNEDGDIVEKMTPGDLAEQYAIQLREKTGERITSFVSMKT